MAPLKTVLTAGAQSVKSKLWPRTADGGKTAAGTAGSTSPTGKGVAAGDKAATPARTAETDQSTATALAEVQRKTEELAAREKALNEREAQLLLEEQRLAQDQEAFLKAKVSAEKLATMYGAMKPSEAAAIIAQLPERQAANLLALMDEEQAGKIMALVDKSLAVRLTVMLTGN